MIIFFIEIKLFGSENFLASFFTMRGDFNGIESSAKKEKYKSMGI